MVLSEEDVADLIADLERAKRELQRAQQEKEAAIAEKELQKREYEAELEWLQYETELEWLQSENVEMLMCPLLEGPQQSAPKAVALAAEAPAAEVMTGTRIFPDTAGPDASVARVAIELTSTAGPSSKTCGERRAFRYYNSSWPKHDSNSNRNSSSNGSNSNSSSSNSSGNGSSSSSNDTTSNYGPWWDTSCVVALL